MRPTQSQRALQRLSQTKRQQPVKRFTPSVTVTLRPSQDFFVSNTPSTTRRAAHRLIVRDGAKEVVF